jgi:ribonuclease HI
MSNKLTVYTGGSYKDKRAGWAFVIQDYLTMNKPSISYGACNAADSVQAEAVACLKAIDNVDLYGKYDYIIIRTDQLGLVKISSRIIHSNIRLENLVKEVFINDETRRIALIQKHLGPRLRFEKVIRNNHYLRLADKYARRALELEPDDNNYWYMENSKSQPIYLNCQKNSESYCVELNRDKLIDLEKCEVVKLRIAEIDLVDTIHFQTPTLILMENWRGIGLDT